MNAKILFNTKDAADLDRLAINADPDRLAINADIDGLAIN